MMPKNWVGLAIVAVISASALAPHAIGAEYVAGRVNGTLWNIDENSIRDRPPIPVFRPFPVKQAWFTMLKGNEIRWTERGELLISMDCEGERMAILKSVTFYPNDDAPSKDHTWEDDASRYDYARPGSVGYSLLRAACDR